MLVHPQSQLIREPRLLVPNRQPLGQVRVDKSHPFAKTLKRFFIASQGPVDLVTGERASVATGFTTVTLPNGDLALSFSSGSITIPVSNVSSSFVLAGRVLFNSVSATARIFHLTKDTGTTTIAGPALAVSTPSYIYGQNYDGTNEVTTTNPSASAGVWYDVFYVMVGGSTLNVNVNGVDAVTKTGASWTAGPNRFTFGRADWSTEYFPGLVQWWGYWETTQIWEQKNNNSQFRLNPYEMLIPA